MEEENVVLSLDCNNEINDPFLRCPSRRKLRFINHQSPINHI